MKNIVIKLAKNNIELAQILELQEANYIQNVSVDKRDFNGFVIVKHSLDLLKKMNTTAPQIVAVDNGHVVGYALVMLKEISGMIPVLKPMFLMFEKILFNGKPLNSYNYYVMGQICIAEKYRGQGVFELLYEKHKAINAKKFDFCLTEVSVKNIRSMKAHEKVGFKIIKTFKDETDTWNILLWDWK